MGVDFLVDAVSSLGAEELSVEEYNMTFCSSAANKAIGSLPGLSFVCGKRSAFEQLKGLIPRTKYLDLYRYYEYAEGYVQTPNTPAVSLFFALDEALSELLSMTVDKQIQHYAKLAKILRQGLKERGFSFVVEEEYMSSVLTCIYYPEGIDVELFHHLLKEQHYVIYQCKGPLQNRAFQIANIGAIKQEHIYGVLNAIDGVLKVCHKNRNVLV
nr:aminotransferase class V-fold PLP-dependent enzyme [Caldalkalibacillus mannanilyticus]